VKLEWDDRKRNKALAERGLDFADVAWVDWDTAFTVEDTRVDYAEARFVTWPRSTIACAFSLGASVANKRERNKYEKAIHQP
jgi:uncharacterized DUF497 family protein